MIIAIDPGITTGVAIRHDDGHLETFVLHSRIDIREMLRSHAPDCRVVCEEFASGGFMDRNGEETLRTIGDIAGSCWFLGIEFIHQYPNERRYKLQKATELLKNKRPRMVHEVDALAHLLTYEDRQHKNKQELIIPAAG